MLKTHALFNKKITLLAMFMSVGMRNFSKKTVRIYLLSTTAVKWTAVKWTAVKCSLKFTTKFSPILIGLN